MSEENPRGLVLNNDPFNYIMRAVFDSPCRLLKYPKATDAIKFKNSISFRCLAIHKYIIYEALEGNII